MSANVEHRTEEELVALLESLLDPESIAFYGRRDALQMCASALGISTSSAIMFDDDGHVVCQLDPFEVERRIDFVMKMKAEKNWTFIKAIRVYFQHNPQPDPLASLDEILTPKTKRLKMSGGFGA